MLLLGAVGLSFVEPPLLLPAGFGLPRLLSLLLLVVGVVAAVEHQLPIAQLHDPVRHAGDEVTVVGHKQGGAVVGHQGVLEHLLGRDVQVVGGLIQYQQVAGGEQHQGQGQPGLFPPGQLAHLLEHGVVTEAEVAQQAPHLGLGPVGHRLEEGVDHAAGEVEGLGLVLLEVAGHHVVFAQPRMALLRLLQPHDQSQQGGFAGPVRPHEGDAIAALHLQAGPQKQDPLPIAVGEVVDHGHLPA